MPLKIPQMRGTHADIGFQIGVKSTIFPIGKGETYRNPDDFYKLPGKYAVRSLFSLSIVVSRLDRGAVNSSILA